MNTLYLIPLISGLIGYLTNYIAIKMLFRPRKPFLKIQGLIPKRKKLLSKKVAEASIKIMPKSFDKIKSIPIVGDKAVDYLKKGIEEKVNSLDESELENIVMDVARKELRFIEFLGFVLGFCIGLLQLMIV